MTEPRFGINRRAVIGFGGSILLAIVVLTNLAQREPPVPAMSLKFDSNAPAHPIDLLAPPENVTVVTLSDADLAARGITRLKLGDIDFPSGAIVAADPVVQPERPAFARKVTPGRYAITLYGAQARNALIELRLAPGTPVRWQLALLPGQDARTLKKDEIFGYPVDAGLGTLMDAAARDALLKRDRDEQARPGSHYSNLYDDVVAAPLEAAGNKAVLLRPLSGNPATVPIVESGWGDGFYATYWGLDANGDAVLLVTDFEVLEKGDGRDQEKR